MTTRLALLIILATLAMGSSAHATLQSDTVAYWNFDTLDDAGMDGPTYGTDFFADQSGNSHSAVISLEGSGFGSLNPQSATVPAPSFGMSFRSERGTDQNAHIFTTTADHSDLDFSGTTPFTFSLWTRSDYNQSFQRGIYFSKVDGTAFEMADPNVGYMFSRTGGNGATTMRFQANDGSAGPDVEVFPDDGSDQWDNDEWAQWTLTYDGAGTLNLHVNGVLRDTETLTTTLDWSNDDPFHIAHREGQHQRSFVWPFGDNGEGYIDDFGIIRDDLTIAEANAIYNLAMDAGLGYTFDQSILLFDAHRTGGSVLVGGVTWTFATDLVGTDGQVIGGDTVILNADAGTGLVAIAPIPEPATATLGLLALAGLAARRRRVRTA